MTGTMRRSWSWKAGCGFVSATSSIRLEGDWTGAELAVGDQVVLHLGPGMPRCVMVDQAQAGVAAEPKTLKSLGAHNSMELGLQARAGCIGTLRIGDVVTLRRAMSPWPSGSRDAAHRLIGP